MRSVKSLLKASALAGLVVSLLPVSGALAWNGGGTLSDPYQITNCTDLQSMNSNLSAHYVLTQDVDCDSVAFTPVGNASTAFTGHFDGDGFTIYDLTINAPTTDDVGLFGVAVGATIKDVTLYGAEITGQARVGGIVGHAHTSSDITHAAVTTSTVIGQQYVGGLVGSLEDSAMSYGRAASITVSGSRSGSTAAARIGGAIGHVEDTTVSKSFVTGSVAGNNLGTTSDSVGGFVGEMGSGTTINDSYSTASVTAHIKAGGFVGGAVSSSTNRSWASGAVEGTTDVGGFVGYEGLGMHTDSFAMGSVTGVTNVGGFFGHVLAIGGDATNSYFDVTRTGLTDCVGLDEGLSYATTCTGVNTAGAQPDYFHNNATNEPLDGWNFTSVWRTTATTPTLVWVPERPDNVRVVPSPTSLIFSWEVPADTGGSAVTSYDIRYRASSSTGAFTSFSGLSASTLSQTLSNLVPSTEYTIYLRANNAVGHGVWAGIITNTSATSTTATTATTKKAAAVTTATVSQSEPEAPVTTSTSPDTQPAESTPVETDTSSVTEAGPTMVRVGWIAVVATGLGVAAYASLQTKKVAK